MKKSQRPANTIGQFVSSRRRLILLGLLLAAAAYVVIPQLGFLGNSWSVLLDSDWQLGCLAVLALFVSYGAATGIYTMLASVQLELKKTYLVQMASSFAARALPAGIGSIGVNYLYLRRQGQTKAGAATIVAVNNAIGFVGHGCWLLAAVIFYAGSLHYFGLSTTTTVLIIMAILALATVGVFWRQRVARALLVFLTQLRQYRRRPGRLVGSLGLSIVLTGSYITMLWLAGRATGLDFSIGAAVVALTVGVLAQTATPTPGGIGGAEAGLVGGLVVTGMPVSHAITVTVLYRVITYWFPLIVGAVAFWWSLRRGYIR